MTILEHVKDYCRAGLKPIPVIHKTKKPFGGGWNRGWTQKGTLTKFKAAGECNIGILLGDVIDVEADTPDANKLLDQWLYDVKHPVYRSVKSKHHLFRNPYPWLTRIAYEGIELRAHRHCSLLPPSLHPTGVHYEWIDENNYEMPYLPNLFGQWILRKAFVIKALNKSPYEMPWCEVCGKREKIPWKRFQTEVKAFKTLAQNWRCHVCRSSNISALCREIKHFGRLNNSACRSR